jgi:hypothetical protein
MQDWATALIAVETMTAGAGAAAVGRPGRGRLLAHSALLDAGSGGGHVWLFDRAAWEEAQAIAAGVGRQIRAVRMWDAIAAEGAASPVDHWYLSASVDLGTAALEFDDPAIGGAIRRTLASYLPLLGRRLIATSTLMSDWRHCCGALTAFAARSAAEARTLAFDDPWRAIFPGRLFRLERAVLQRVLPPAGPTTQRYGGANPWPGGTFG